MKGKQIKIIFVMACLFLMVLPITQAIDSNKETKQTNSAGFIWGRIIEAHCDARYTPDVNGSYGTVTERYFVLGFGRHTITINHESDIYWQQGSWNNDSNYNTGDKITLFHPIARRTYSFHTSGFGEFIFGMSKVTLSVDGVLMDSEYCFYPTP